MHVSTKVPTGDFVSPFGSLLTIPQGVTKELDVESYYWLIDNPSVTIQFVDSEEETRAKALVEQSKLNPLKPLNAPDYLGPNATLQMAGGATRHDVIVVNPVGLLADKQTGYEFGAKPQVTLFATPEMIKDVVKQVILELNSQGSITPALLEQPQPQPPVDNDHVAEGATPFTDAEIEANKPVKPEGDTPATDLPPGATTTTPSQESVVNTDPLPQDAASDVTPEGQNIAPDDNTIADSEKVEGADSTTPVETLESEAKAKGRKGKSTGVDASDI